MPQVVPTMVYRFDDVESLTRSLDLGQKLGHMDQGLYLTLAPDTVAQLVPVLKAGLLLEERAQRQDARAEALKVHGESLLALAEAMERQAKRHLNEQLRLAGFIGLCWAIAFAWTPIATAFWGW